MPLSRRTYLSSAGAAAAALGVRVSAQDQPQLDRPSGDPKTLAAVRARQVGEDDIRPLSDGRVF